MIWGLTWLFLGVIRASYSVLVIFEPLAATGYPKAALIVYGAGVVAMTGLWFLVLRRRHSPPILAAPSGRG